MAAKKAKEAAKPTWETCPFTGLPINVVQLSNGKYQVRGLNWICTHYFDTEYGAKYWAGHRDGVEPTGLARPMRVEVVGERAMPEPDPIADLTAVAKGASEIAREIG